MFSVLTSLHSVQNVTLSSQNVTLSTQNVILLIIGRYYKTLSTKLLVGPLLHIKKSNQYLQIQSTNLYTTNKLVHFDFEAQDFGDLNLLLSRSRHARVRPVSPIMRSFLSIICRVILMFKFKNWKQEK